MKKEKNKRVVYYSDEANDDFMGTDIKARNIDASFKFVHKNVIWRALSFILYYFVAVPLVALYERVILRVRFVNKRAVRALRHTNYFLYGNHTGYIDAFTPNMISFPKRNMIVTSPDAVSIKGIRNIVQMLGAIPTPNGMGGMKNFARAVEHHHKRANITVYPEAHIWPYYTGVREFSDGSFFYPVKYNAPIVVFFTAYSEPKGFLSCFRRANVTVYVSDPMYPAEGLSDHEKRRDLRDRAYAFMQEMSKKSDYEVVRYVRRRENNPTDK